MISLEEVDHFEEILSSLAEAGYHGYFHPKKDSPCLRFPGNSGPDGLAMFYRTDKFELVGNPETNLLSDENGVQSNPMLLLSLKVKSTGHVVGILFLAFII